MSGGLAAALVGWGVVKAASRKRQGMAEDGPGGAGAGAGAHAGALAQDCGALLAAKTACEQEVEEMCAIMGVKVGRLGGGHLCSLNCSRRPVTNVRSMHGGTRPAVAIMSRRRHRDEAGDDAEQ